MNKIRLERSVVPNKSSMRVDPIYAFESNYHFTSKYSCWQKVVYEASVAVLLLADRIVLIPCTRVGAAIVKALEKFVNLEEDNDIPLSRSFAVQKYIDVSSYVGQIVTLLSNFDADANFGLYGFFSYELINMKLGVEIPDLPLGIFYLPETMSIDQGPTFQYAMPKGGDANSEFNEISIVDRSGLYNLLKFSRGESSIYEHLYDLSQDYISSRKLK